MSRNRTVLSPRSLVRATGILMLALGCVGCGQSFQSSDPSEGRKVLQTVLDAWKGGSKPDSLAQQTPSIHVADSDWTSGLRLQKFQADDEGRLVGADVNYTVKLELKNANGKVTKKTAVYSIATHPQLIVLRQDD